MTLINRADAVNTIMSEPMNEPKYPIWFADKIKALPSANIAPQSEQYKKGFEDAKRVFEIEYAREAESMLKENAVLNVLVNEQRELLANVPHGDTKDCTKFLLWLLEEIMDEENWEMNAVANGEPIARKLKNLGLLEIKDGYYVRTSLTYGLQKEEKESLVDKIKNWRKK